MIVEAGKTYVRRLRAVGATRDALALRLGLERTLAHASLHPPSLPPSAILLVRRLGGERARAPNERSGASVEWERAIAARLDGLARRAARPARELVAASAEAVVFDDQAELLACLAVDWCGGVETTRWWWQSLFGVREVAAALIPAWLASAEHVPAALEHLSRAGKLSAFARALGDAEARDLRRRVTHKFSLRALEDALEEAARGAGLSRPARESDDDAARSSSPAPWERFVPELRDEGVGDEQCRFVGTALMLLRAPAVVRSASFAAAVSRRRLDSHAREDSDTSHARDVEARGARGVDESNPVRSRGLDERLGAESSVETDFQQRTNAAPRSQRATAEAPNADASLVESEADVRVNADEVNAVSVAPQTSKRDARGRAQFSTFVRESERQSETPQTTALSSVKEESAPQTFIVAHDHAARVTTEFGGVFYLVNLALFLNLYGDFTTPLARGIELPVWDFLALAGRELCGDAIRRDPLWPLLLKLSGRDETEEPGAGFEPPRDWRVPPRWLAAFQERRAWKWNAEGGRLRVLHPAGFLVLDVASSGDAREQLEAETTAYASQLSGRLRHAPFKTAGETANKTADKTVNETANETANKNVSVTAFAVEEWLARLMPYVRARLARALGVRRAGSLGRLVCEHRARVVVTATRVDVTFSLAGLPLEVRLAGLDRDPGWVPAAARHVAFHYE